MARVLSLFTTQRMLPVSPTLTGLEPPDGNGEPSTGVSEPSSLIQKTAIVSEPPLTAKSMVCAGLTMTSWSESNGPRAVVNVIPSPPVGNGEPGNGVRLPSASLR